MREDWKKNCDEDIKRVPHRANKRLTEPKKDQGEEKIDRKGRE